MSIKILLTAASLFSVCGAMANTPLWLRDVAISPDGETVAFTYKGDIYTVPFSGGDAMRLTTNSATDANPVWSPDGSKIAFGSEREGSMDIFLVDAKGGTPIRLTTNNSANETPKAFIDSETVLYESSVIPSALAAQGAFQGQMYTVSTTPGMRPKMFLSLPMVALDVDRRTGKIIYQNKKGYEDVLRKHERSSGTPDIWIYNPADGSFKQQTTFNGANQNPIWAGDNKFYYLNDSDGNNNIYLRDISGNEKQITSFKYHPVRSLSASADYSRLAFSQDGQIYTISNNGTPQLLNVEIIGDIYDADKVKREVSAGASNIALSPTGKEIALVLRGDIYVTSTKYSTTNRITNTAGQERCLSFSPDGKKLAYDGEREGLWRIYVAELAPSDTLNGFSYATNINEKMVYEAKSGKASQQPVFSPDGKKIAFLEDRTELKVLDLVTGNVVTALDAKYNYSYVDGDISFEWSPNSKHLLITYIGIGGWNNLDIAMVNADGSGDPVDLTVSGYTDSTPHWTADGSGFTYISGRYGYRSHGSWGETNDVILMMLNGDKWDEFNMTEEELALVEAAEKDKASKKDDKDKKSKKKDKVKEDKKDLKLDIENRLYRTARLTPVSGMISDYRLSPKKNRLFFSVLGQDGKYDLMMTDLKDKKTCRLLSDLRGGFEMDSKGEKLYVLSYKGIQEVSLPTGNSTTASVKNINFEADYTRVPSAEREYIYDHVISQVRDKFYDENIHGVDWDMYARDYSKFLPHINNNRDFAILLSELLGELNASHTGGRFSGYAVSSATRNGVLGAFFDESYVGDGLRISEIIKRGPLDKESANLKAGDVIIAIDGKQIKSGQDYFPLLEGKSHKKVRLTVASGGNNRDIEVKPITPGEQNNLLYRRYVERNRAIVDSVSGGRVAYVHVRSMDSNSFRTVYDELLGLQRNKEAVVVDTRYNGGGWLHNDIAILLSGKEYVRFNPRGRYIGSEPFSQWTKPSVMLTNESNYSDAHGTPYTYKTLGIGKLVGAPVPGTMTAVWWETQVDPSLIFGIPQVTSLDTNGKPLENQQLNPDIEIYNQPADVLKGIDAQLIEATKELLRQLK